MLPFVIIGCTAFGVSTLTLFSGFGLGTLLMPAFAIFFPVEVAVAATAIVHLLNNLFKLGLLHRSIAGTVVVRFGLPAVACAFVGAVFLSHVSQQAPLWTWQLGGQLVVVTPIKAVMGGLIVAFGAAELLPRVPALPLGPRWLPLGGALSGFFGGLSGHQGALRAAFLRPLGLTPAAFAATQAVLGCLVDVSRLTVYGLAFWTGRAAGVSTTDQWALVAFAATCAFAGALLGRRLLPKVTVARLRLIVGLLLLIVGLGLASGLV